MTQDEYYRGIRTAPYDLLKELFLALAGIGIVALIAAAALSSPDVPPVTIAVWSQNDPVDFLTTATNELAGTTTSAGYGNPYNTAGPGQQWGFVQPQNWFGTRIPIDSANTFVIQPLQRAASGNSDLMAAVSAWTNATSDQQTSWLTAYTTALGNASVTNGQITIASGEYGPLPVMMSNLLSIAQAGGLDGLLMINGRFYQTDYTQALLFMGDGSYLANQAKQWNLQGNQWGMMNETGLYPGQTWLWLYTMWYQIPPFTNNPNSSFLGVSSADADLVVVILMTVLTIALALVPFIPILRDIPRWTRIHRLIWRDYYAPRKATS